MANDEQVYDVAIVGYGPTGMVLAGLLGGAGHTVLVLERYEQLYEHPRVATFDDETMRAFQRLGLAEQMLPGAVVQSHYEWVNGDGQMLLDVQYSNPARGGWAAMYMMYQPHIEAVLDRNCRSLPNVTIKQGLTVDGLVPDAEEVGLSGVDPAGARHEFRARFVVGCDGGAGFTRGFLGTDVDDYGFEENWLVCDFHPFRPFSELPSVPEFRQFCDPSQPRSSVRLGREHHRFSFMLDRDESAEAATQPDSVWERVSPFIGPHDAELVRVANYVFRSLVAERWRDGRVLLAGDAAHQMPPFLGQGMCSGIRDAHNLGWKLDLVLDGRADQALLSTYQAERDPHVRWITEKAIELGRVQTLRDPEAARIRDERMLAQRRAQEVPEEIVYPGLTAGFLALDTPYAGAVFPQGVVSSARRDDALFDSVVGPGPTIVCRGDELASIDRELIARWQRLGGKLVRIATESTLPTETSDGLEVGDVAGVYARWFAEHPCAAAVVRPDWYLYGTTADGQQLAALVDRYERGLTSTAPVGAGS